MPRLFFFISKTNLRPKIHKLYLIYGKVSMGIAYNIAYPLSNDSHVTDSKRGMTLNL